jgi:hypothetical protein
MKFTDLIDDRLEDIRSAPTALKADECFELTGAGS